VKLVGTVLLVCVALHAPAEEFVLKRPREFYKIVPSGAKIKQLATGFKFTEGPQWIPEGNGHLLFSDIPADRLIKWTARGGAVTFRRPSRNANGNTLDRQNRLVTCEHGARRVSITDAKGNVRMLVGSYDGKKFNSPNDAVAKMDGTIWFTDPDYGLKGRPKEQPGNFVYRHDPKSGLTTLVAREFDKPNGLCFSADEKLLYVADSGKPKHIRVFAVKANGTLDAGRVFCVIDKGGPDGIRCDKKGRVWSTAGDGVHIFSVDGGLVGKILVPETPANLCFGGETMQTLFITARTSLYSIRLKAEGIR